MNPYLERLKNKNGLSDPVPEVPKATSGTFGTDPSRAFSRNEAGAGWPCDEASGAPFCPWGPRVTPVMLDAWRRELRELVADLALLEGWADERRERMAFCVEHQPGLATLRDDIRYFRDRLVAMRAGAEQEAQGRAQPWRGEGLDARHCCAGCDGSCVGTRRSCKR